MDLASAAVPRPADVVKQVTDPMLARSRSLRLWCSVAMLTPGLIVGIMQVFEPHRRGDATALQVFIVVLICAGLLPSAAVYSYFSAQMKIAPKLVRDGAAITGRITKFLDGGGKKYVTVTWDADGKAHKAKLQATNVSAPMREGDTVMVLASPDVRRQVGVMLGDNGLYLADGG
jgi:hypothetical protein